MSQFDAESPALLHRVQLDLLKENAALLVSGLGLGMTVEQLFYERNGSGDGVTLQISGDSPGADSLARAFSLTSGCSTAVISQGREVAKADSPRVVMNLPEVVRIGGENAQLWPDKAEVKWSADAVLSELGLVGCETSEREEDLRGRIAKIVADEPKLRSSKLTTTEDLITLNIQNDLTELGAPWLHSFLSILGAVVPESHRPVRVEWKLEKEAVFQAISMEGSNRTLRSDPELDPVADRLYVSIDRLSTDQPGDELVLARRLSFRTGYPTTLIEPSPDAQFEEKLRLTPNTNWRGYSRHDVEQESEKILSAVKKSPFRFLLSDPILPEIQIVGNQIFIKCLEFDLPEKTMNRMATVLTKMLDELPLSLVFVRKPDSDEISDSAKLGVLSGVLPTFSAMELERPRISGEPPKLLLSNDMRNRKNDSVKELQELLSALGLPPPEFTWTLDEVRAVVDQELNTPSPWNVTLGTDGYATLFIAGGHRAINDQQRQAILERTGLTSLLCADLKPALNSIEIGEGKRWRQSNGAAAMELADQLFYLVPAELHVSRNDIQVAGNRMVIKAPVAAPPELYLQRLADDLRFFPAPVVFQFQPVKGPLVERDCLAVLERSLPPNVYLRDSVFDSGQLVAEVLDLNERPAQLDGVADAMRKCFPLRTVTLERWEPLPEVRESLASRSDKFARTMAQVIDEFGEIKELGRLKEVYRRVYEMKWPVLLASAAPARTDGLLDLTGRPWVRIEDDPTRTLDADDIQYCARLKNGNLLVSVGSARIDQLASIGGPIERQVLEARSSVYAQPGEITGRDKPQCWVAVHEHLLSDQITSQVSFATDEVRPAFVLDMEIHPRRGIVHCEPKLAMIQVAPHRVFRTSDASALMQEKQSRGSGLQLAIMREAAEALLANNPSLSASRHQLPVAAEALRAIMLTADEEALKLLKVSAPLWAGSNEMSGGPSKRQLTELKRDFAELVPRVRGVTKGLRESGSLPLQRMLEAHTRGEGLINLGAEVGKLKASTEKLDVMAVLEERLWLRFFEAVGQVVKDGRAPMITGIDRADGVKLSVDLHGFRLLGVLSGELIFGEDPRSGKPHVSLKNSAYRSHSGMEVGSPVLHPTGVSASILHPNVEFSFV